MLKIKLQPDEFLGVRRAHIGNSKLVYVLLASKKLTYRNGKSRIAYIGTTKSGISRIAQSAAYHAEEILDIHGVISVTARIVTCKPRRRVQTWRKLERALLIVFRESFGEAPWQNSHGRKISKTDEFEYFKREAIERVIEKLG